MAIASADAALLDLILVRGDDFSLIVDVEGDRDADAFAAAMRSVRNGQSTSFTVTVGAYDSGAGTTPVTLALANTVTDDLDTTENGYAWDLEWTTAGGVVRTLLRGSVTVVADVTA